MWWNVFSNRYECLNKKCHRKFSSESIVKYREDLTGELNHRDDTAPPKSKTWNGTHYWDDKRKEWRESKKPAVHWTHNYLTWVFVILGLIIVGIVITLIISYF